MDMHPSQGTCILHKGHASFTRDMHPSQGTCILHKGHASFTRDMHPSQGTCILHKGHASFTRDMHPSQWTTYIYVLLQSNLIWFIGVSISFINFIIHVSSFFQFNVFFVLQKCITICCMIWRIIVHHYLLYDLANHCLNLFFIWHTKSYVTGFDSVIFLIIWNSRLIVTRKSIKYLLYSVTESVSLQLGLGIYLCIWTII